MHASFRHNVWIFYCLYLLCYSCNIDTNTVSFFINNQTWLCSLYSSSFQSLDREIKDIFQTQTPDTRPDCLQPTPESESQQRRGCSAASWLQHSLEMLQAMSAQHAVHLCRILATTALSFT